MSEKRLSRLAVGMASLFVAISFFAHMAFTRCALAETIDEVEAVDGDSVDEAGGLELVDVGESPEGQEDGHAGPQSTGDMGGPGGASLDVASDDVISVLYVDLSAASIEPIPTQLIHGRNEWWYNEKGDYVYGYHYRLDDEARPDVTVVYDGKRVDNEGLDFWYQSNDRPGTGTVEVRSKYNLSGPKLTATFAIELDPAYDISKAQVGKIADCEYSGREMACPDVNVTLGGKRLGDDCYIVDYDNNHRPGLATATIRGTGEYTGERRVTYRIIATLTTGNTLCYNKRDDYGDYRRYVKDQTYTGKAVVPSSLKVEFNERWTKEEGGNVPAEDYKGSWWVSGPLRVGRDYTVSYENNVNPGRASVVIRGMGYYKGTVRKTFWIRYPLSKAKITGIKRRYKYRGWDVEPMPKVKALGKTLKLGRDYTLEYWDNDRGGKATVAIKGKGGYKGTVRKTYVLTVPIKYVKVARVRTQIPYHSAVRPNPVVKIEGHRLKRGRDFTVSYKNNTQGGTATMVIKGKGYYKGTKRVRFKILPRGVGGTITKAEYNRLKLGMSYEAVECLIGGPGELTSESHSSDYDYEHYEWHGNTAYGFADMSFENDELTYKYQYGLA